MPKILLVDDSTELGSMIKIALNEHSVQQAMTLKDAHEQIKGSSFDLVLIDIVLPDGSGFDFCLHLSQDLQYEKIPRILLTAKDQPTEKVYGFQCGADDYITKPFNLIEFKARVDRYFKRRIGTTDTNLTYSCFLFNSEFQKCYLIEGNNQIDLKVTPTEFRLLLALTKNEGHVLSRKTLETTIWESVGISIKVRGIDTHIAHLRKKLGSLGSSIISIYGQGYSYKTDKK